MIWGIPLGAFVWGYGRASRKQFWIVIALQWGISFGLGFVAGFLGALLKAPSLAPLAILIFSPIGIWIGVCNIFRRLHDLGRSGWWCLLAIPAFAAGGIVVGLGGEAMHLAITPQLMARLTGYAMAGAMIITLGCLRGQAGFNKFGASPTGEEAATFD